MESARESEDGVERTMAAALDAAFASLGIKRRFQSSFGNMLCCPPPHGTPPRFQLTELSGFDVVDLPLRDQQAHLEKVQEPIRCTPFEIVRLKFSHTPLAGLLPEVM